MLHCCKMLVIWSVSSLQFPLTNEGHVPLFWALETGRMKWGASHFAGTRNGAHEMGRMTFCESRKYHKIPCAPFSRFAQIVITEPLIMQSSWESKHISIEMQWDRVSKLSVIALLAALICWFVQILKQGTCDSVYQIWSNYVLETGRMKWAHENHVLICAPYFVKGNGSDVR